MATGSAIVRKFFTHTMFTSDDGRMMYFFIARNEPKVFQDLRLVKD